MDQHAAVAFLTFPQFGTGYDCEIKISHIGKNSGNLDLVCKNKNDYSRIFRY